MPAVAPLAAGAAELATTAASAAARTAAEVGAKAAGAASNAGSRIAGVGRRALGYGSTTTEVGGRTVDIGARGAGSVGRTGAVEGKGAEGAAHAPKAPPHRVLVENPDGQIGLGTQVGEHSVPHAEVANPHEFPLAPWETDKAAGAGARPEVTAFKASMERNGATLNEAIKGSEAAKVGEAGEVGKGAELGGKGAATTSSGLFDAKTLGAATIAAGSVAAGGAVLGSIIEDGKKNSAKHHAAEQSSDTWDGNVNAFLPPAETNNPYLFNTAYAQPSIAPSNNELGGTPSLERNFGEPEFNGGNPLGNLYNPTPISANTLFPNSNI